MTDETTQTAAPAVVKPAIRVINHIDGEQAKQDVAYSLADLSSAMQEQASLHLHYGELAAKASRQVDDLKITLEAAESKVYRKLRDDYDTAGKKITEKLLEMETAAHPTIHAIKKAINEAKQIEAIAKAAVQAFGHRKDMLVQHGAKDRVELQGELRIQAANANSDAQKEGAVSMLAKRNAAAGIK